MASTSSALPAVIVALLLLVAFVAAGVSFGVIETLLVVAFVSVAAILSAFVAVAASRNAY
jgi:hypothetical protein